MSRTMLPERPLVEPSRTRRAAEAMAQELARLRVIAQNFAVAVGAPADGWLDCVPSLDGGGLGVDHAIRQAHHDLRTRFLRTIYGLSSTHWRTPATGQNMRFPGDDSHYTYAYDRQHAPVVLESRLANNGTLAPQRDRQVLLCSSGMAAIHTILQALGFLERGAPAALGALASYFETLTLLRISPFNQRWQRLRNAADLADGIRRQHYGVILIEPVRYDWDLGATDWHVVLDAIAQADQPPIVVVDTTLSGRSACWNAVERSLLGLRIPLLVCVRSGLKLDQQGFELANLGVIEAWGDEAAGLATVFRRTAASVRVVTGAGIGWPEACCLAPAFVLDSESGAQYCTDIASTNRALFEAVRLNGTLFNSTVHPAPPWSAPLVLYRLREDSAQAYQDLAWLLQCEAARRGLGWVMSGSFGFRSDRYETILPAEQSRTGEAPQGVLKVAAGCYQGARFHQICDLLEELASFDSISHAKQRWYARTISIPYETQADSEDPLPVTQHPGGLPTQAQFAADSNDGNA